MAAADVMSVLPIAGPRTASTIKDLEISQAVYALPFPLYVLTDC